MNKCSEKQYKNKEKMCGYAYLQSDLYPGVAEQADALVLETSIERCVSSSLTFRTNGVLPLVSEITMSSKNRSIDLRDSITINNSSTG